MAQLSQPQGEIAPTDDWRRLHSADHQGHGAMARIWNWLGCRIGMTQFKRVVVTQPMQIEVHDISAKRVRRKPQCRRRLPNIATRHTRIMTTLLGTVLQQQGRM
jgi:hypothetical protein